MNFKEAYEALKQGCKIKRSHWAGYWDYNPETKTIEMHRKDGRIVSIRDMEDVLFTFDNICQDDWEVLSDNEMTRSFNIQTFTFGEAIRKLKQGFKVARQGWNGKGMYLWLMPATSVKTEWCKEPHLKALAEQNGGEIECLGSIRMKTADNKILTGWLASQTDMLSEDWTIVKL